jgi:type II secretory pathway pseudopilin PulG
MMIVMVLISLMAGIAFPTASAGLESIRLSSAADSVASFINSALNRAARRGEPVEITIVPAQRALLQQSLDPGSERKLELPEGIRLLGEARSILLLPGGTPPAIGIEIVNGKGTRRIVRVDPMTGVPRVERPQ